MVYFFSEVCIIIFFHCGFYASTVNTLGRPKKEVSMRGLDSEKPWEIHKDVESTTESF
jgi:hypothetical protein